MLGSKKDEYEWRDEVKIGDTLDILKNDGSWTTATVVGEDMRAPEDKKDFP